MYEDLFQSLREHLTATIILFVILANLIAYLFAGKKIGSFYLGALRTLASLFYSPILYLKGSFLDLANFGKKGEKEFADNKQYLLNKFLIFAQLLLVVISVSIISAGIVSAWNAFLPPKYLRDRINEFETSIAEKKNELSTTDSKIQQMDKDWVEKKDQLIINYKNEKKKESLKAVSDNRSLESSISGNEEISTIFSSIKNYLDVQNGSSYTKKYEAINYIERQYISSDGANQLKAYAENWYIIQKVKDDLGNFSEENLRSEIQPDYNSLKQTSLELNGLITRWEADLVSMKAELKYNFTNFILIILSSILVCIITVWVMGIFLELLGLSINMAGDIRRIRSKIDERISVKPQTELVNN